VERPSDRRNGGEDGDVEVTRSVRLLLRYCYAMQSAVLHGTRWNGGGGFPGARLTMRAMLRRVGPAPRALSPVGRFLPCGPRTSRAPHVGFYYKAKKPSQRRRGTAYALVGPCCWMISRRGRGRMDARSVRVASSAITESYIHRILNKIYLQNFFMDECNFSQRI